MPGNRYGNHYDRQRPTHRNSSSVDSKRPIIVAATMMGAIPVGSGLTTRAWLADKRLYFWGAFLGIAFLFSPDPTGMAPIMVAATMIGLFESTLLLLRWVGR